LLFDDQIKEYYNIDNLMEPNQTNTDWAFILAVVAGSMSSLVLNVVQGKYTKLILELAKSFAGFATAFFLTPVFTKYLGLQPDFKAGFGFVFGLWGYNLTETIYIYGNKLRLNPEKIVTDLKNILKP
jgi:hypothetical protein